MSLLEDRKCEWCKGPIPAHARADARTCKKSCRQMLARFRVAPADGAAGATPIHFGFMDPPYPGLADRYYSDDERCAEVDHEQLIADARDRFPDAWALCSSSDALEDLMVLCRKVLGPRQVRVAVWNKGPRSGVSWRARDAYEIVIIYGGRPFRLEPLDKLENVLSWGGRQHGHPDALVGMKPAAFCEWVFRQVGALAGDYMTDVFPGSGAVMRAWREFGGRDPSEQTPTLHLPFDDIVTAPPVPNRLASTTSRLEEATARAELTGTAELLAIEDEADAEFRAHVRELAAGQSAGLRSAMRKPAKPKPQLAIDFVPPKDS